MDSISQGVLFCFLLFTYVICIVILYQISDLKEQTTHIASLFEQQQKITVSNER